MTTSITRADTLHAARVGAFNARMAHYGATYETGREGFGEITSIFEVAPDWEGYRFHGYTTPTPSDLLRWGYAHA